MDIADVDGDGRADVCVMTDDALECALALRGKAFGSFRRWSEELTSHKLEPRTFRLADVDGDHKADACIRSSEGILCGTSTGSSSFGPARVWLAGRMADDRLELADLNGDGRADFCGTFTLQETARPPGITCALSNGHAFADATVWSVTGDFAGSRDLHLADLNGDGRADACAIVADGVACALSSGRSFKHSSVWSRPRTTDIHLGDVNGDGRSDLCTVTKDRLDCGMAP
jgi:hypothetical protein